MNDRWSSPGEWTPIKDGASFIGKHVREGAASVAAASKSDLLRYVQDQAKRIAMGECRPWQALAQQFESDYDDAISPIDDHFLLDGDGGRVSLPDDEPIAYRGAAPHTYRADPAQVRRIAGKQASGSVSKIAVSANGNAFKACVPRKPSHDLIVVASKSHSSSAAGAWLMPGVKQTDDSHETHVYLRDDMELYSDLVYEHLEAGAHIHCCSGKGLEPEVESLLESEAGFRGLRKADARAKLEEWRKNGQFHTECMCSRASEVPDLLAEE